MTFGSAKHNWGVDLFLELFAEYAPQPSDRNSTRGSVSPVDKTFSGFIFKIQAKHGPQHRSATMRVPENLLRNV